jgi:hypothetical protein
MYYVTLCTLSSPFIPLNLILANTISVVIRRLCHYQVTIFKKYSSCTKDVQDVSGSLRTLAAMDQPHYAP